jgi:hypothetical protein
MLNRAREKFEDLGGLSTLGDFACLLLAIFTVMGLFEVMSWLP